MKNLRNVLALSTIAILSGCSTSSLTNPVLFGKTYAEEAASFSYVPIEPTLVETTCGSQKSNCSRITKDRLLDSLPDNSVRLATQKVFGKGNLNLGFVGASIGSEGNTYDVIIDFVNTETVNVQFLGYWQGFRINTETGKIQERITSANSQSGSFPGKKTFIERPFNAGDTVWRLVIYKRLDVDDDKNNLLRENGGASSFLESAPENENIFNIPTYIGIGLRLRANVTVLKGKVDLSSLGSIAAAVESERASGTLSVQTIGVTGKTARESLQLINKIDDSTIQSAIQSLASIKASIDGESTSLTPRVLGIQNTIGVDASGINTIHSYLASLPLELNILDDSQVVN